MVGSVGNFFNELFPNLEFDQNLEIETRILCALSKSNTNLSVNSSVKDKIYHHINSEKDVSEMYLPK